MTLAPLPNWHGWQAHYGYTHADPFSRPLPIPSMGIFDSPDVTICFNSKWAPILLGALGRLTYPELYIVNEQHDGIWAQDQAQKFMGVIAGAQNPCVPLSIQETECAYYPSWYAGIEYIPHNPFNPSGSFDPQYPVAPFFRFANIDTWFPDWLDDWFFGAIENITGYRENDVFVSFFSLPTYQNPFDGLDYPTIKLTVQGTGTVKLKFLLVPFGGRALISFDPVGVFDILTAIFTPDDRIIELNRDILSAVPETDLDAIEEIQITEDGTHEIYITFLPTINDEAPIFQFGGGFRGYEVCGNLTVIDAQTGEPIDLENPSYQEGVIVATEQDLYNALVRMETERANRWLLASTSENIKSNVEIEKTTGGTIVKDTILSGRDPVEGKSEEVHYGGVYNQAYQFAELFNQMNEQESNGFVDSIIQRFAKVTLDALESTGLDTLVSDYTTYLETQAPITIDVEDLALRINCRGFRQGLVQYVLDNHGASETVFNLISDFAEEVTTQTEQRWYDEGALVPRDGYQSSACYRFPTVSMVYGTGDFTNASKQLPIQPAYDDTRYYRIEITGKLTGDTVVYDGMFKSFSGGVPTYDPVDLRAWESFVNVNTTGAPEVAPSYELNGGYKTTYRVHRATPNPMALWGIQIPADVQSNANLSGSLTIRFIDLGSSL